MHVRTVSRSGFVRLLSSLFLASCLALPAAYGEVELPALISDHMVLQADADAPIWGWASPGVNIAVTLGEVTVKTTAGQDVETQVGAVVLIRRLLAELINKKIRPITCRLAA